jgi:hypothetical protein
MRTAILFARISVCSALNSVVVLALFLAAGCSNNSRNQPDQDELLVEFDRTRIAIIPYDSVDEYDTPLDKDIFSGEFLRKSDLSLIDSLLIVAVNSYNASFINEPPRIDLTKRNYRLQLVCVLNPDDQREVWVNCFCVEESYWERSIVNVNDGGTCFFNFRINLDKKQYSHFVVNGYT